jgi:fatty-acid desaturase
MGEGLHNNHHAKPNEYNQAMAPGEFDIAGWIVEKYVKVDPNSKEAYKV